ncbi:MBL fold metallo-hydrolase, partial [Clostridioides difficile]
MERLKIQVLVDNNTYIDRYFVGEPAVSYYIEIDGNRILFDSGYSDV